MFEGAVVRANLDRSNRIDLSLSKINQTACNHTTPLTKSHQWSPQNPSWFVISPHIISSISGEFQRKLWHAAKVMNGACLTYDRDE